MTTYRIAEVAERSGFTATTLRYYEQIGLLPPPMRTAAGYRIYDHSTLDRLRFIGRAKQLGCTLDEVRDLVALMEADRCAPVQDRLRQLVDRKIAAAEQHLAETAGFVGELQRAASTLAVHTPAGPCDERCGCTSDAAAVTAPSDPAAVSSAVVFVAADGRSQRAIACTLAAGDVPQRLADWHEVDTHIVRREPIDGGLRCVLAPDAPVARIAELARAEQRCCSFLAFTITIDGDGVALEVRAPREASALVAALIGAAPR